MKKDTPKTSKPSERLAAQKPDRKPKAAKPPHAVAEAAPTSVPIAADVPLTPMKPTKMQVATKFVVTQKTELPIVVGKARETRWHVKLEAVYEARSILNGLATEQGNADNRIFGDDEPEAEIRMVIHSKAIADTFQTGHAFGLVFTEMPR